MTPAETSLRPLVASDELSQKVTGEAAYVHRVLGPGFPEFIYANALLVCLGKLGLKAETGLALPIDFEDHHVGDVPIDMVVEDRLLLVLKSVPALVTPHDLQLAAYLIATRLETGLLINFGGQALQVKRRARELPAPKPATGALPPVNGTDSLGATHA